MLLTRKKFLELPVHEQQILYNKFMHAIRNNDHYFMMFDCVIGNAELDGMFVNVKFGSEIKDLTEAEADLLVQEKSIYEKDFN
jgi:hypothetical protein